MKIHIAILLCLALVSCDERGSTPTMGASTPAPKTLLLDWEFRASDPVNVFWFALLRIETDATHVVVKADAPQGYAVRAYEVRDGVVDYILFTDGTFNTWRNVTIWPATVKDADWCRGVALLEWRTSCVDTPFPHPLLHGVGGSWAATGTATHARIAVKAGVPMLE